MCICLYCWVYYYVMSILSYSECKLAVVIFGYCYSLLIKMLNSFTSRYYNSTTLQSARYMVKIFIIIIDLNLKITYTQLIQELVGGIRIIGVEMILCIYHNQVIIVVYVYLYRICTQVHLYLYRILRNNMIVHRYGKYGYIVHNIINIISYLII